MLLFLCVILVMCTYIYLKRTYFTLRPGIPGISPQLFFGNLLQTGVLTNRTTLIDVFAQLKDRFGDVYQIWLGPGHFFVVNNINDVQHIFNDRNIYDQGDIFIRQVSGLFPDGLICIKGAAFKRHAAVTLPLFRRNKVIQNLDLIIDSVDQLLTRWRERPEKEIHTDIFEQMQDLYLQIFGIIGFDYDFQLLDHEQKAKENQLTQALQEIAKVFQFVTYTPTWISIPYLKLNSRYRQAQATIQRYIYRLIDQELNTDADERLRRKRTSLIASLVASLQTDETIEAMKNEEDKKGLSRREVLNEIVLFLMAGSDTTATATTWFIHLMSKYPRVQEKIKAELTEKNVVGRPTIEQLDSLIYLDCVVKEVLRFIPPVNGTIRTLTMDDRLPTSGAQLYKGDSVYIPFLNLSHDPRHWSIDPKMFYPERFLGDDKNHSIYASIPFGSGHRQCIGQELARFEFKVVATRLMQQVTFGDGGEDINAGGYLQRITVLPKSIGVTFTFA